jgi:hypothetical protein
MKKIILTLLVCCTSLSLFADFIPGEPQKVLGRSFMLTRPVSYRLAANQQLWHSIAYNNSGSVGGATQVIGFYEKSMDNCENNRYFLFRNFNQLLVAGDATGEDKVRNVRAEWLNLPSNFHAFMTAHPKQMQAGFALEYLQHLDRLFDASFFENSWLTFYLPVLIVRNNLQLCQYDARGTQNSPGKPATIQQAFNQKSWHFARINGERTHVRLAEIRMTLGKTYLNEDFFQILYYSTLVIPTGNKQNPRYTFDSVAGNNAHPAMGGGVNFQVTLNRDISKIAWCFFANLEALYLFRNEQCRTFDLKGKPWSRYMLYNLKDGPPNQNIPGVNLLTYRALVRPYGWFDFCMGYRFKLPWLEGEIGFSVWGHEHERLKLLRHQFDNEREFGIAGVGALEGHPDCAASASESTIKTLAPNDPEFVSIKKSDINLYSAGSHTALNLQAHAGFGYTVSCNDNYDGFIGGGFYFDIPKNMGSLQYWGIWGKLGTTF